MPQVKGITENQRNYIEAHLDEMAGKKMVDKDANIAEMTSAEASKLIGEYKHSIPASEKQMGMIARLRLGEGVDMKTLSQGAASELLDKHFSKPITPKQQELLVKNNLATPEAAAIMTLREFQRRYGEFDKKVAAQPVTANQIRHMKNLMPDQLAAYEQKTGLKVEDFRVSDYREVRNMRDQVPATPDQQQLVTQLAEEVLAKDPDKFKARHYDELLKPDGLKDWNHGRVQNFVRQNVEVFNAMPASQKQIDALVQQGIIPEGTDPSKLTRAAVNDLFAGMNRDRQSRDVQAQETGRPAPEDVAAPHAEMPEAEVSVSMEEDDPEIPF